MTLRVLLVEDRPDVRAMLRILLRLTGEVEVIGEAVTGDEAVTMSRDLRPEAVVLDLRVPGVNGRDLCTQVIQASPGSRVVAYSAYHSADRPWYVARGVPLLSKDDTDGLVSALLS